jgi:mitosis inhibitor protein kinase SWE1
MSFSNSSGGTLALPSPTHAHTIDVSSAVRTLRRSISRSPSRFLARTGSNGCESSRQPSPQSPCRRFGTTPQHSYPLPPAVTQSAPPAALTTAPHSSTFTPLRPSLKLSLRSAKSAKSATPTRPLRSRTSPRSPLKKAINNNNNNNNVSDVGNSIFASTPPPIASILDSLPGQENLEAQATPSPDKSLDKPNNRHSVHLDVSGASSQYAFLRTANTVTSSTPADSETPMVPSTGNLKRSDATMNLDHPNQGSPMAKRRSMHGVSGLPGAADLSVFGNGAPTSQSFDIHEDSSAEYELGSFNSSFRDQLASASTGSSLSKRASLRRSTLQQRYGEKTSWGRRSGERQLAQMSTDPSSPARNRPRLSSEHFVSPPPQVARDGPFAATSSMLASFPAAQQTENKAHQPHPLSKALTPSSSGNSLTEVPPSHLPVKVAEKPKHHLFSRSLPLNATRPTPRSLFDSSKAVATPNHSRGLNLIPFHSTGLISKVNRNPEEEDKKLAPPDTPCKKHSNPFATFPPPAGSAMKKRGSNLYAFSGLPATPFKSAAAEEPGTFGNSRKGLGIFQRGSGSRSARRGSVLSLDGEERRLFGETSEISEPIEAPGPSEADAPPTPTKNTLTPSVSSLGAGSADSPSASRTFVPPMSAVRPAISRESTRSPVDGRRTPQTPREGVLPLDTSRLAISQAADNMPPPVTPTTGRDFRSSASIFVTPVNVRTSNVDMDASLHSKFDKVEQIGKGEFSTVYRVAQTDYHCPMDMGTTTPSHSPGQSPARGQIFAVKKSKHPFIGHKDREAKLREVHILQALTHAEHVVRYIDHWEEHLHLYIQTEFCEEGTLATFLSTVGRGGRLDDFRIFKILQDLSLGIKEIHDAGFMHLDMKPANILITFEGALKIGDFGLARPCSVQRIDMEGDREYMAPEMLDNNVGQPADIFSLGLISLEAAANVVLPDNGPTWRALRSGDLTEVPGLTWNSLSIVERDLEGNPTESHSYEFQDGHSRDGGLFGPSKRSEMQDPPAFMIDASNPSSLDSIVSWMTAQEPANRPTIDQVLGLEGLRWVSERRNAPATVYEGNWGPVALFPVSIAAMDMDTEMTDV